MRSIVPLVVCIVVACTAGCDSSDKHYFKEGVGTNLYPDDVAAETELQNAYVADVCRQAGLEPSPSGTDVVSCGSDNAASWWQFVQAGMNDIDRRCDAYLTWLDNVRRAQAPTIKQIADTQTATTLIMQAAGVGAPPIAIAAAAFGFATNTFNNVSSRLILEVNHSTVQTVVLTRQTQFRQELLGDRSKGIPPILIANRSAAIFALRSYLRFCMPLTIESEINTTVTVFERAGAPALMTRKPMISAKAVGPALVISHPAVDTSYRNLRAQLFPAGSSTADPAIVAYVRDLFGPPPIAIGVILNDPRQASLRQKISACIVARAAGQACQSGSLAQFR